jgi:hypothetical protein
MRVRFGEIELFDGAEPDTENHCGHEPEQG